MKRTLLLILCVLLLFSATAEGIVDFPSATKRIEASAFEGDNSILGVRLPEGVTAIESRAFANMENLEFIDLPDTLVSIADDAFEGCPRDEDGYARFWAYCHEDTVAYRYCVNKRIHTEEPSAPSNPVIHRALLVGNSEYPSLQEIAAPDYDTKGLSSALSGYPVWRGHVTVELNLTSSRIESAIRTAFADTDENDISLFYFSGYGTVSGGALPAGSLIGVDSSATAFPPQTLYALLSECVQGNVIVILDCDGAGGAISAFKNDGRFTLLTSCAANEELDRWSEHDYGSTTTIGHSYFTRTLCIGAGFDYVTATKTKTADADGDHRITANEMIDFIKPQLQTQTVALTGNADIVMFE